jgi:hypothetical protein
MSTTGHYADNRKYTLPESWNPLDEQTLQTALSQTLEALTDDDPLRRLAYFYDPLGEYAGTSFLDAGHNSATSIEADDLYAVSRLSITVTNRQGRCLLDPGSARDKAIDLLAALPTSLTITASLDATVLGQMWELHDLFRTLLATDTKDSNQWVFAAKLCARKRPNLFPVRDSQVCGCLSGWKALGAGPGGLGRFSNDIQVFAYLMTHDAITGKLTELRETAADAGLRIDDEPLRLLDALPWTRATGTP